MDSRNEDPEFDALGHAWHEGWDAGVTHVEYPLNLIWERWDSFRRTLRAESATGVSVGILSDLIDDIGDLLDFLGK